MALLLEHGVTASAATTRAVTSVGLQLEPNMAEDMRMGDDEPEEQVNVAVVLLGTVIYIALNTSNGPGKKTAIELLIHRMKLTRDETVIQDLPTTQH